MARTPTGRRSARRDAADIFGGRVLVCDGAMGTMLQAAGVSLDLSLPELSVSRPELVRAVHGAYIAAGADIIETNTFGACRTRLARHGLEERTAEINLAAVRIARAAAAAPRSQVLVAGSVGPATPPNSRVPVTQAVLREAFREQINALHEGGVDLILFETFGSLGELQEAIGAANDVAPALPLLAEMTFLEDGRTLAGETPAEVAIKLEGSRLAVLGVNCTLGPQGLLGVLQELSRHTSLPLVAQPNAGPPSFVDGRFQYSADPAYFARYAGRYVQLGAVVVGGCCGTTPAHIEAVAAAVKGLRPTPRRGKAAAAAGAGSAGEETGRPTPSRLMERLTSDTFVVIGELGPPAGGAGDRGVRDASLLRDAGCEAVLVGPPSSVRAQVSPASLAFLIQQQLGGLEPILTVATWEKSVMTLQADLLGAHAFGIRHVVCRTGMPPLLGDYPNIGGIWDVDSVGLIELLRGLNAGRDRHGIPLAQPTSFVIGARINPAAEDRQREIEDAQRKVAAGVHFLVTPPVYEVESLEGLLEAAGVPEELPVLLGVMPLRDFNHAEFLEHEVPDTTVPERLIERMWQAGDAAPVAGVAIARELIEQARASRRIRGVVVSSAGNEAAEVAALLQEGRA